MDPDLIDADNLVEGLWDLLGLDEARRDSPDVLDRLFDLEQKIDDARAHGQLTRYERKSVRTGELLGHAYKRVELARFLAGDTNALRLAPGGVIYESVRPPEQGR